MKVARYFILFLFASVFVFSLKAQNDNELKNLGLEAYESGNYYKAARYLKEVAGQAPGDSILFFLARSYGQVHNHQSALKYYQKLINREKNTFPQALFYAGMMHKHVGKYQQAAEYILKYNLTRNTLISKKRIDQELKACDLAAEILKDTLPVRIEHPGKKVNSDYTDFGAVQPDEHAIYFSSLRPNVSSNGSDLMPRNFQTNIYKTSITQSGYKKVKTWKSPINQKKKHSANIAFSPGGDTLYFTRCKRTGKGEMICRLFLSYKNDGEWSKPEELPDYINKDSYTTTHPFPAVTSGQDILYFSSDRPNGHGKMDIWYSVIQDDEFATPVNLGYKINTPGDEITPFYHSEDSTLYFSSDWHPGLGGYDIFRSKDGFASWEEPENIGYPLNTPANDLYFTLNDNNYSGYLTSNRPGSYFVTSRKCCNDIYYFQFERTTDTIPSDTSREKDTIDLAVKKARSLLPITLYFDNDIPDPARDDDTTAQHIDRLIKEYVSRKPDYIRNYARNEAEREKMNNFFKNIRNGQTLLDSLVDYLYQTLKSGRDVHLELKGYASPLTTKEYNLKLSKRRIVALKNYLISTRSESLKPYLKKRDSVKAGLFIYPKALGQKFSSGNVSDNPADKRNSIYSLEAAKARKIVITELRSGKSEKNYSTKPEDIELKPDSLNIDTMKSKKEKMFEMKFLNKSDNPLVIENVKANELLFSFHFPAYRIAPGSKKTIYINYIAPRQSGSFFSEIKIHIKGLKEPLLIPVYGYVK